MNKKLSVIEVCSFVFQIILSAGVGLISYISIYETKQDAWITILFSMVIGIIPLLIYLYLMNYKPNLNIFSLTEYLFGNKLGKIINTIITVIVSLYIMLTFYNLINFIGSQYLNKTSTIFITIIFIIPLLYLLVQNLNVIGRVSFVLLLFSIFLLLFTLFGLIGEIDINNIKPVLKTDIKTIFISSLKITAFSSFQLITITSIAKEEISNNKNFNKSVFITYLFSILTLIIFSICIISILGRNLALIYQYPEYNVLKRISLAGFIERIENTLSLRWIFYMFTSVIMGLYFIKCYLKKTFNLTNNFIPILISLIILLISNFIFKSNTVANYFILYILPIILYCSLGTIIVIIFIQSKIKKR